MSEEMRLGMVIAYQGVKEEMDTIKAELSRKGIEEPKGFSVLDKFLEDSMKELSIKIADIERYGWESNP